MSASQMIRKSQWSILPGCSPKHSHYYVTSLFPFDVTRAGCSSCKLPPKTTEEDKEVIQEVSVGLTTTEAPPIAEPGGIFTFKEEQRLETICYHLSPDWSFSKKLCFSLEVSQTITTGCGAVVWCHHLHQWEALSFPQNGLPLFKHLLWPLHPMDMWAESNILKIASSVLGTGWTFIIGVHIVLHHMMNYHWQEYSRGCNCRSSGAV